jgi:hypothetical protein
MSLHLPLGLLRLLVGAGLVSSVVWQVSDRIAFGIFRPGEYFAYFSIVTAIIAGLVMITTGIGMLTKLQDTKWIEIGRLSLAVAMIVVGSVYHLLLADSAADARDGEYAWPVFPNEMIHTYAPILILLDYLLSLEAFQIRLRAALWGLVFPMSWLVFSAIRGSLSGWWPYWFLDPTGDLGLLGVLGYVAGIAVLFLVLGFALLGTKKLLRNWLRPSAA